MDFSQTLPFSSLYCSQGYKLVYQMLLTDILCCIYFIIYILTAENLGVCFSFFLENYVMDFSQTLPFSSLYCSQGYKLVYQMLLTDILCCIYFIIYILTAENLGVCFSFFLENYVMDFSQTLPFSSLYCSQGYKQKSKMCCYFCLATKCEICQNLPVLAPIYGLFSPF